MLEKIMNLHLLLYAMTVLGWLGVLGMLATHLTYRRLIRKSGTDFLWDTFMWEQSFRLRCFCSDRHWILHIRKSFL